MTTKRGETGPTPGGRGRFDGYDVLREVHRWDDETKGVVLARVGPVSAVSFFDVREEAAARALLDRLLSQDAEPRIPVLEMVDARLANHVGDGWRHEDMPEDWDAWKLSLAALDKESDLIHGKPFCELDANYQKAIIESIQDTKGDWHGLPAKHVFELWMRYALPAFYSHPWAWNEIGFGGPAYPRGYKNLGIDKREPWEVPERDAHDPVPWAERVESAHDAHRSGSAGPPDTLPKADFDEGRGGRDQHEDA